MQKHIAPIMYDDHAYASDDDHSSLPLAVVVAAARDGAIGAKGSMLWRLPHELRSFNELTRNTTSERLRNAVIMGRHTYDSIPRAPLAGRINVVLTRSKGDYPSGVLVYRSFDEALHALKHMGRIEKVFAIGGAQVYSEAMKHPTCERVYLTRVHADYPDADTFFPYAFLETYELDTGHKESGVIHTEGGIEYEYMVYSKKKVGECAKGETQDQAHSVNH